MLDLERFSDTAAEGIWTLIAIPFVTLWFLAALIVWPVGWLKIKLLGPTKPDTLDDLYTS